MRKHILTGAGVCTVAAGLVLAASPAQAAGSYTTNCDARITVNGNVGDQLTITFGAGCTPDQWWYLWNVNGTYYNPSTTYTESGFLGYVSSTDPSQYASHSDYADDWYVYNPSPSGGQSVTVTILGRDGGNAPLAVGSTMANISEYYSPYLSLPVIYGGAHPADEGTPIPDVIQQVGAPAGGCSAVDDAALNWGGVKSGGWTSSWAEWADGGTGGSVCTRTLHYDHGWTVTAA